jgi:hypothetical protein
VVGKELRWGETPWDGLPREALLREVQRMYAALVAARSALKCLSDPSSSFWSPLVGTGGLALVKIQKAVGPVEGEWNDGNEVAYDTFFRYANDLLFGPEVGHGWAACDGCPHLLGGGDAAGKPCVFCAKDGRRAIRRPLEWKDLGLRE